MADKLAVAERHAWYILNALETRVRDMRQQVDDAKAVLASEENDGSAPYRSLQGMVDHVWQAQVDFQRALDDLREAGFR